MLGGTRTSLLSTNAVLPHFAASRRRWKSDYERETHATVDAVLGYLLWSSEFLPAICRSTRAALTSAGRE
jgi:hypothetical protein